MLTGLMSSGGGAGEEVVKVRVRIKETPASSASVEARAILAYLALSNNRGHAKTRPRQHRKRCTKHCAISACYAAIIERFPKPRVGPATILARPLALHCGRARQPTWTQLSAHCCQPCAVRGSGSVPDRSGDGGRAG